MDSRLEASACRCLVSCSWCRRPLLSHVQFACTSQRGTSEVCHEKVRKFGHACSQRLVHACDTGCTEMRPSDSRVAFAALGSCWLSVMQAHHHGLGQGPAG